MIPEEEYKEILKKIPICCVDVIIINAENNFLLAKRTNEPAKGKWWLPGGRILKNETIKHAALRKSYEETGLKCKYVKRLGVFETIFDKGPFGSPVHTVNIICLMKTNQKNVLLDKQNNEYLWCSSIDKSKNIPKEIIECLKKMGFKYGY